MVGTVSACNSLRPWTGAHKGISLSQTSVWIWWHLKLKGCRLWGTHISHSTHADGVYNRAVSGRAVTNCRCPQPSPTCHPHATQCPSRVHGGRDGDKCTQEAALYQFPCRACQQVPQVSSLTLDTSTQALAWSLAFHQSRVTESRSASSSRVYSVQSGSKALLISYCTF